MSIGEETIHNPEWREAAVCPNVSVPEIFTSPASPAQVAMAKQFCARCGSRYDCLNEALTGGTQAGEIWGGMTEEERNEVIDGKRDKDEIGVPLALNFQDIIDLLGMRTETTQ